MQQGDAIVRQPSDSLFRAGSTQRLGMHEPQQLADILERVLDKGIVVAGDIQVRLLDIELLTIKIRLVVASLERAKEVGIDWWEADSFLSTRALERELPANERRALQQRVRAIEQRLKLPGPKSSRGKAPRQGRARH